jgi:hypothetical protein
MRYYWLIAVVLLMLSLGAGSGLSAEAPAPAADSAAPAAQPDSLSALIDVLVEKGVLAPEEAENLKQRAAEAEKPAPPPAPEKPKYPTLKTKMRLQARFSQVQEDTGQPYFGDRDDQTGGDGFAVRRARFYLQGDVDPKTGYLAQFQSDQGQESVNLHVAQVEWKGWDFANLVAGQLQTPFGYEIVLSDAYLLPIDRSAVSNFLPADKDIGLRLDGKKPILGGVNYQLFFGNGSGKYLANPNHSYLSIARITAEPLPDLSLGASVSSNPNTNFSPYQSRFLKKNGDPYGLLPYYTAATATENSWGLDGHWRSGPNMLCAEYMRTHIEPDSASPVTADGYYIDYLHMLPYRGQPDKLELVLGYQQFDPNRAVEDKYDLTAYTLGLNYHLHGNRDEAPFCGNMIRFAYVWMKEAVDPVDNNKFVAQYQTWF